ncbi:MAG: diaminopimelate epimerase [Puniceicoccales bacterium]|jgi:diaminopimelate epimerase|nr:diaminopimelate epimerase [Puniceicoccales bacterium]
MRLTKYCALGNDYWVIDPVEKKHLSIKTVQFLCHRHQGLGGDGVLQGPTFLDANSYGLKIWNADGSSAAISGNGLTIFARYLADKYLDNDTAQINLMPSKLRKVTCHITPHCIELQLGLATLCSKKFYEIPKNIKSTFDLPDVLPLFEVDIGNPHCVVPVKKLSPALAKTLGPLLEKHPWFPDKTNVQFVHFYKQNRGKIEIWERGSGYTLGSGSSACAVAFIYGIVLGLTTYSIGLTMPGGKLQVNCNRGYCSFRNQAHRVVEIETACL